MAATTGLGQSSNLWIIDWPSVEMFFSCTWRIRGEEDCSPRNLNHSTCLQLHTHVHTRTHTHSHTGMHMHMRMHTHTSSSDSAASNIDMSAPAMKHPGLEEMRTMLFDVGFSKASRIAPINSSLNSWDNTFTYSMCVCVCVRVCEWACVFVCVREKEYEWEWERTLQ